MPDLSYRLLKVNVVSGVFSKIPVSLLGALTRTRLLLPYYHIISDDEVLHVKHLYRFKNTRQFKNDIEFLLRHYDPISLHDLLRFLNNGASFSDRVFLLTFDDGFKEIYDVVAPILLEKGIPATFFINSAFTDNKALCHDHKASLLAERIQEIDSVAMRDKISGMLSYGGSRRADIVAELLSVSYCRRAILDKIANVLSFDFQEYLSRNKPYLTSGQVTTLIGKGFTIGAHSIDHPSYSAIGLFEKVRQTVESIKFIKERFSLKYGVFAFPYSDQGISKEFFTKLNDIGGVDACFGTGGMMDDSYTNMFQRVSLEKTLMPADKIIAYQYARKLFKILSGKGTIVRKQEEHL